MLKIRVTFTDNKIGQEELNEAINKIEKEFNIISKSKIYQGRGESKYNNIYLDVENK